VPPLNDNFADAQLLAGASGTVAGDNTGATLETGEPHPYVAAYSTSVWFTWDCPADGTYDFHVDPASAIGDTVMGVFTGTTLGTLVEVASSDDDPADRTDLTYTSRVRFQAVEGTTYRIAVGGYGGGTGTFTLAWAPAPMTVIGPATLLTSAFTGYEALSSAAIDDTRLLLVFGEQNGAARRVYAAICTLAGNTLTVGAALDITSSGTETLTSLANGTDCVVLSADRAVVLHELTGEDNGDVDSCGFWLLDISGATPALVDQATSGDGGSSLWKADRIDDTRAVVAVERASDPFPAVDDGGSFLTVIDTTGDTISVGTWVQQWSGLSRPSTPPRPSVGHYIGTPEPVMLDATHGVAVGIDYDAGSGALLASGFTIAGSTVTVDTSHATLSYGADYYEFAWAVQPRVARVDDTSAVVSYNEDASGTHRSVTRRVTLTGSTPAWDTDSRRITGLIVNTAGATANGVPIAVDSEPSAFAFVDQQTSPPHAIALTLDLTPVGELPTGWAVLASPNVFDDTSAETGSTPTLVVAGGRAVLVYAAANTEIRTIIWPGVTAAGRAPTLQIAGANMPFTPGTPLMIQGPNQQAGAGYRVPLQIPGPNTKY